MTIYIQRFQSSLAMDIMDKGLQLYHKFLVPNLITCLLEVAINSLLLHALRKRKKLRITSFRLFAILSISDISLAIFSILIDITFKTVDASGHQMKIIRLTSIIGRFLFGEFSALMTVLIAVDRYLHLRYPLNYKTLMTPKRSMIATCSLFLVSFTMIAIFALAYLFRFYKEMLVTASVINLFIIIASCCIYCLALKSIKKTENQTTFKGNNSREFSRALLFILSSQVLLYAPFILIKPISEYTRMNGETVLLLAFASQLLVFAQGIMNALIFICFHKETRRFIKQLLVSYLTPKRSNDQGPLQQRSSGETALHLE